MSDAFRLNQFIANCYWDWKEHVERGSLFLALLFAAPEAFLPTDIL